jgi:peptidoglycan/xylan/chitin deacetylase (PgdA/CDA1 family)
MKRIALLLSLFCSFAFGQQKITWPQHKKAIIVLTYDDALNSQLDIAIPQLDAAHLKATFFLTGYLTAVTIPRWRAVAKKGYELANHTLYHPCLGKELKGTNETSTNTYSVFTIVREIGMMNNVLFAIDGKQTRTYAYPCTETKVDGISYVDSLRKSGLIKYARIGGDERDMITDFKKLDPFLVPAWGVSENTPGAKLIGFVKKVEQSGGMGIFMFHGIGGDYLTTPAQAHKELLDYLQRHKNELLVLTFQQAMDYIAAANKTVK